MQPRESFISSSPTLCKPYTRGWCGAGGLFMPSIMVGSSFGAACGLGLMGALPSWNIQPGLYAMCAAAAMLGGVFRASISLVVIVVEGTQAIHPAA